MTRWLVAGIVIGSLVPLALVYLVRDFIIITSAFVALSAHLMIVIKIYRGALAQTIQLLPNKIVFDFVNGKQEFLFNSSAEWKFDVVGKNCRLTAIKDGSQKLIPISAFPQLGIEIRNYYGK